VVIAHAPQPVLSDGRPEQIAAEPFRAHAIGGRHGDIRVEIEPGDVRVPRMA